MHNPGTAAARSPAARPDANQHTQSQRLGARCTKHPQRSPEAGVIPSCPRHRPPPWLCRSPFAGRTWFVSPDVDGRNKMNKKSNTRPEYRPNSLPCTEHLADRIDRRPGPVLVSHRPPTSHPTQQPATSGSPSCRPHAPFRTCAAFPVQKQPSGCPGRCGLACDRAESSRGFEAPCPQSAPLPGLPPGFTGIDATLRFSPRFPLPARAVAASEGHLKSPDSPASTFYSFSPSARPPPKSD
jgi:hypothetical protein